MKWTSCREKLPPTHHKVLVIRRIELKEITINTHDIGILLGTDASSRWNLESQQFSPLPTKPTVSSGIITHWMELPKMPE